MIANRTPRDRRSRARRLPSYRHLGCPMTRGFLLWCYGTCRPHKGRGACGRLYPWQFRGTTQKAIARNEARSRDGSASS
jgi:hypothetical protein